MWANVYEGAEYGIDTAMAEKMGSIKALRAMTELYPELRKRGLRVLPGGDYGFPNNPIGRDARDLERFVRLFGYSPTEALRATTQYGGHVMDLPVGLLTLGYLADVLVVRGEPTEEVQGVVAWFPLTDLATLLADVADAGGVPDPGPDSREALLLGGSASSVPELASSCARIVSPSPGRHARASAVSVQAEVADDVLRVAVRDDAPAAWPASRTAWRRSANPGSPSKLLSSANVPATRT